MTSAGKKQVLAAALIVFTVWPALHIVIARQTGMSSWKLAGWGMYATPRLKASTLHVYGRSATGSFQPLTRPNPAVQQQAALFLERFRWLSTLAQPNALAATIAAAAPGLHELRVYVLEPVLAADTGMIQQREVVYEYDANLVLRRVTRGVPRDRS